MKRLLDPVLLEFLQLFEIKIPLALALAPPDEQQKQGGYAYAKRDGYGCDDGHDVSCNYLKFCIILEDLRALTPTMTRSSTAFSRSPSSIFYGNAKAKKNQPEIVMISGWLSGGTGVRLVIRFVAYGGIQSPLKDHPIDPYHAQIRIFSIQGLQGATFVLCSVSDGNHLAEALPSRIDAYDNMLE